ncbi:ATP-dependent DNA ligase [Pseudokineococcus basanitobsidens]|uniref:DNA ligase (ATP) n=1 Tax=Pseudokineococcus basanitobsidens TaxID=1926649 RepID=A0ABU8RNC0_9ACTN
MLLSVLAASLEEVAATSSRRAKAEVVAGVLRAAASGGADEREVVVRYLEGELRQRRTGLGWRSLADPPSPATEPVLEVLDVDTAMASAAVQSGTGADGRRRRLLQDVLAAATAPEQRLVAGLVSGELRQGAQRGVLVEGLALAAGVPAAAVRRALTLSGDVAEVAATALGAADPDAARSALAAVALRLGRPVSPMLAASAPSLAAALERTGTALVEWKLDGVRVQVHRDEQGVRVWTRTLEEVTARLPEVVAAVAALPARTLVLDGEVLALRRRGPDDEGTEASTGDAGGGSEVGTEAGTGAGAAPWRARRPAPFQQTSSRVATRRPGDPGGPAAAGADGTGSPDPLQLVLFDVLHRDGEDLLDAPQLRRREVLLDLAPDLAVPGVAGSAEDPAAAAALSAAALALGHEGVVVKAAQAPYAAGRRGAAWVKVKPRLTLDLVVLAVEHGSGRRRGTLSNLWLGARDPHGRFGPEGGFVMLGKTFKGLTDTMLAWQTERLRALAVADEGGVVRVRPELVVEIALDGVQTSPRYPAGLALRFARVLAHRPDKPAAEADVVEELERLHAAAAGPA